MKKGILGLIVAVLCWTVTAASLSADEITYLKSITSTGQQAFNTDYLHKSNTRVEMDCLVQKDHQNNWEALLGARKGSYMDNAFCFFSRTDGNDIPCFNRSGHEPRGTGFVYGERILLVCEGTTATWYRYSDLSNVAGSVTTTGTADGGKTPMFFFNLNTSNKEWGQQADTSPSCMTLYGAKIYQGAVLVCDFVPAKKNGVVGLYDRARDVFSGSITGTAFIPGPEVGEGDFVELLKNGVCDGTFDNWDVENGGDGWTIYTADDGTKFWGSSYALCTLSQTITLSEVGISDSDIDALKIKCQASAMIIATWEKNGKASKVAEVVVEELDASGNVINTVTVLNDVGVFREWTKFETPIFVLSSGTRKLRYVVRGEDIVNWLGQYGPCFNNLSLKATVLATEPPPVEKYNVTASAGEGGGVAVNPEDSPEGSDVAVFAYPSMHKKTGTVTATTSDGQKVNVTPVVASRQLLQNGVCDGTYDGWEKHSTNVDWKIEQERDGSYCWVSGGYVTSLSQTFDLAEKGVSTESIDKGLVGCVVSLDTRLSSEEVGESTNCLELYMLDDSGEELWSEMFFPDPDEVCLDWTTFGNNVNLKPGTRKLKFTFTGCAGWQGRQNNGPRYKNAMLKIADTYTFQMPASDVTVNASFSDSPEEEYMIYPRVEIDGISYLLRAYNGTAEVIESESYSGEIVIPGKMTYNGKEYTVTVIRKNAFLGRTNVTSIKLPSTLKSIEEEAFYYCTGLTSIIIPEGVTTIGSGAFSKCKNLVKVSIPSTVTSIGEKAFADENYNLQHIYCAMTNPVVVPEYFINNDKYSTAILFVPIGTKAQYKSTTPWKNFKNIIEFVEKESDGMAFCYSLDTNSRTAELASGFTPYSGNISIPSKVTFDGVQYNVTGIGRQAFYNCKELTSVSIPTSVKSIGVEAFYGCSQLTSITLPNTLESIKSYAFRYCTGLTSMTIPASVTSIAYNPFYGCVGLKSIKVQEGNTAYDSRSNCNGIIGKITNTLVSACPKTIIPTGVQAIGYAAFGGLSNLTDIKIPSSVTVIDGYAFYDCGNLKSVEFPNGLTTIGSCAFMDCSKLTSITIPSSVTSVGQGAFSGCSELYSFVIGKGMTVINEGLFRDCTNLRYITIPENIESIGEKAFWNCPSLVGVSIGSNVKSILPNAFYRCIGLKSIVCLMEEPMSIEFSTFQSYENALYNSDHIYQNATLYVPVGTKSKYQNTSAWNLFTNIVEDDAVGIAPSFEETEEGTVYDLQGRKVMNPRKGIYIKNSKKVLFK